MTRRRTHEEYVSLLVGRPIKVVGTYVNSSTKIEHLCLVCNTTWFSVPSSILNGTGCPQCAGTATKTHEQYTEQISARPIRVIGTYISARTKITHECTNCGYQWKAEPSNIIQGKGCPQCAGNIKRTHEQYVESISSKPIVVLGKYINAITKVDHQCLTCGHTWSTTPGNISQGHGCPTCASTKGYSKAEREVSEFIKSIYTGWIELNDRSILEGKELDIVLPDLGLAIEYNGTYWHREAVKGRTYHLEKTEKVEEFGYRLIHINEDEWYLNRKIVESRLLSLIGQSKRLYARKCVIRPVENVEATKFLDDNHIQGSVQSSTKLGLYHNDILVAIMTFGAPRFNKRYDHELLRYCSLLGHTVVGGAGKLLNHFRKTHLGSIISYADRRWSSGGLYKALGFSSIGNSAPNYKYYKGKESLSRYACQKHKLVAQGYDATKTEAQIMETRGYTKMYDCGSSVWVLE